MRDQPTSCAWNLVKEAYTFLAMGLFSDSSLTTSLAIFFSSRSTAGGNGRISTLPLNSVLSFSRAIAFFASYSLSPYTWVAAAAWSRIRRRSTGSASYALLLKANSSVVAGSCQPG